VIYWIRSFLKLKDRHYSSIVNQYKHVKGSAFFTGICFLLFLCSCTSADYQVTDTKETRVVVDSFVQADKLESLDILVVLDTSGSMSDNFNDVADGMELLRADIENLTLDYQFGYITMDPTRLGYLGPYSSSSTAIDMLMAPSLLPMTMLEEGFGATYTFLSTEEGLAFRRPEADFLLFLISDEDEQSAITDDLFYDWMHDEFKDVNHDIVCVVNPDDGSQQNSWSNEIGFKYIDLSNLYGKNVVDLQAEDWSVWLSDSSYIVNVKDSIALSAGDPIVESITVYIDHETTSRWSYSKKSNRVELGFTPDHGSLVEVGYKVYM
tara:strand:+ start:6607 stop:7572 length:966 start_codon:yes stop_codon:yes gene_type:complete